MQPKHTIMTKVDILNLAERVRRYGSWGAIRQSEQLDLILAADTLIELAGYCSVDWPVVIARKQQ